MTIFPMVKLAFNFRLSFTRFAYKLIKKLRTLCKLHFTRMKRMNQNNSTHSHQIRTLLVQSLVGPSSFSGSWSPCDSPSLFQNFSTINNSVQADTYNFKNNF